MFDVSVSLVIPCFNHAPTLARAVQSGLAQSDLHEIIVVDDGSVDNSLEVARALERADVRIRVLQTEHNGGPGSARNAGARAARASHIAFLDADDELLAGFFREAIALMVLKPELSVVKGEMEFFDPIKGYILPPFDPRHSSAVLSSSCGMVMARSIFERIGGFPEDEAFRGPSGGEDVAFMQALMTHFQPIGRIEQPSYRVWSQAESHVDRFLSSTRLTAECFEFIRLHQDQEPDGLLARSIGNYLASVETTIGPVTCNTTSCRNDKCQY